MGFRRASTPFVEWRNLSYPEMIFRHHRHYDLSFRLVTQTVDEFFLHDVAKMIFSQYAINQ